MNESSTVTSSSRIGLILCAVYTIFYAGFVLTNAFAPELSEWIPFGGINLAVLWGFALIGLAFILAMVYGVVRSGEDRLHPTPPEPAVDGDEPHNAAVRTSRREDAE